MDEIYIFYMEQSKMKKWRCLVCGYIHEGEEPPEKCPKCGAPKEKFELISDEKKEEKNTNKKTDNKTYEADVLVVGTGAAAFAAAITAKNEGAEEVIMFEKGSIVGGTTIRSGGGYWVPNNKFQKEDGIKDTKEDGLSYMARYSYPQFYNKEAKNYGVPQHEFDLLEAYYDNAAKSVEYLEEAGALVSTKEINWTGKPQVDYQDHLPENKGIRGRTLYPANSEGKQGYGYDLVQHFSKWAEEKELQILLNHEVVKILQGKDGKVTGLDVKNEEGQVETFKARKGVVFGSGGYSHNKDLMLHFQRGPYFGGCAAPTNTGDFIKMAGEIGARLGNMSGAFRAQSVLEGVLEEPNGSNNAFYITGDSIIEVNKYGKRVMNEKRNYTDRTMTHFEWDENNAEWKNMLLFAIYDERTLKLWTSIPPFNIEEGQNPSYLIKGESLEDLTLEIENRLEKHADAIGKFSLDESFLDNLKNTIKRFNTFAKNGKDEDFNRGEYNYDKEWTTFPPSDPDVEWPPKDSKNYTMYPISEEGPYYAIIFAAGTLDTNGGPVINPNGQVLDWNNEPIPGLYGAGNCIASPTANAYWGAGATIGPAMTFGYLAGMDLMKK